MLYASEVNRKALRRTLISCTAGTAEKKKKKAKQKGALFPVILKEGTDYKETVCVSSSCSKTECSMHEQRELVLWVTG